MNGYWLALWIVISVLAVFGALLIAAMIVRAVCDVKIARATGSDPRQDLTAVSEASRQVRGQ